MGANRAQWIEHLARLFFEAYSLDLNGPNTKRWSDLHPFQRNAYIAGIERILIEVDLPEGY